MDNAIGHPCLEHLVEGNIRKSHIHQIYNQSIDVYSLGLNLLQMITGIVPYSTFTTTAIVSKVLVPDHSSKVLNTAPPEGKLNRGVII